MHSVILEVERDSVMAANTPAEVRVDFAALIPGVAVDPETIQVWCEDRVVPHQISDEFRYTSRGTVWFVVEDARHLRYRITVEESRDRREDATPRYLPAIGVGDPLYYNAGQGMPFAMGHGPQISDIEGNGRLHLTAGTHWYSYYGWPPNVVFHRIGEETTDSFLFGPNAAVRFRDRTKSDTQTLSEDFYVRHHIVDWNGDGILDMVTVNSGAKQLKYYRNTGAPGPVFELVGTFPLGNAEGYLGVHLVDLCSDGRLHPVIGGNEHLPGHEQEPYTSYIQWYENLADPHELPRLAAPRRLKLEDGADITFTGTGWGFMFADLDGDGKPDLLYERSAHKSPLVWYRNVGWSEGPVFRLEGTPDGITISPGTAAGLGWAETETTRGPIIGGAAYQLRIDRKRCRPVFESPKAIVSVCAEVNGGGQAWPHPCEWDGDGDLDLLTGAANGHIQLFQNIGTRRQPIFEPSRRLEVQGEEIRIWRDGVFGGTHWHGMAGYTCPVFADWDGDGLPDLVVGNETNRLFWFRNEGTRSRPVFGSRRQIEVDGFEDSPEKRERSRKLSAQDGPNSPYPYQEKEAFFWRQKVAVIDWNGDGLADLVAVDGAGHYCLYERYRSQGELRLRKSRRFTYVDGSPVTHDSLPRETSGTDALCVCDWNSSGRLDILVGTCYAVFYLENVGSNEEPAFAPPVRLKLWGKEIRHSRHGLNGHAVDWDGDGRLSWLAGSESGMFFLFRRAALDADTPPNVRIVGVATT